MVSCVGDRKDKQYKRIDNYAKKHITSKTQYTVHVCLGKQTVNCYKQAVDKHIETSGRILLNIWLQFSFDKQMCRHLLKTHIVSQ